ncbi:MAG TPA: hypothetical protein VFA01_07630 [Candidatus Dormibacteraeota bacterium]|jgi:hypothetical protein|nr:hypothetical protein [Candidatus Dormibacteraeota bacterium]
MRVAATARRGTVDAPGLTALAGALALAAYLPLALRNDAQRPDYFLLADAFLRGRTWIEPSTLGALGDRIDVAGRTYLPFGPFPAVVLAPVVALLGPSAAAFEPVLNAALAAATVGLCWKLSARFDGGDLRDRLWIVTLYAFSTPVWWIAAKGGVWHTAQLFALALTFLALLESTGRRRALVVGLLAGAAFLSRAPTLLAVPFYIWAAERRRPFVPIALRRATVVAIGCVPALAFFCWYNATRFGSPLESGYALATLDTFLDQERRLGLFSLAHLGRNLDYLLLHLPVAAPAPWFLSPDGFGLSVAIASPGLFLAVQADLRDRIVRGATLTAVAVLLPSLLYYGGGWFQLGFRYLLDAMPFLVILIASGARRGIAYPWKLAIVFGMCVSLWGFASLGAGVQGFQ